MPRRVTHKRLLEVLDYNPASGEFRWRETLSYRAVAGKKAGYAAESSPGRSYWKIGVDGRYYYAHILARFFMTKRWPKALIDHRDGDGLHNAYDNLRDATQSTNAHNRWHAQPNSSSGLLGATHCLSLRGAKKFRSVINVQGHVIYLGTYMTAEEAHAAYLAAKSIHHPTSITR